MTPTTRALKLVGGIVAYRDGERVARSIRSLRAQKLPKGATWAKIWVVVAPDSEGTLEYARRAAVGDPRIEILEESDRRGKAAALAEIFRRASGDVLVLLNGDAEAEPGAIARILRTAAGARAPWGVMARPTVPPGGTGAMYGAYELLWGLHHRLHAEMYSREEPTHLSDELLALSVDRLPPIGPGVVNDGAHLATWIHAQGGELRYAEAAQVRLSLPAGLADHVAQRRRIFVGHRQVYEAAALPEATLIELARQDPRCAARLIWSEARRTPRGFRSLAILVCAEAIAQLLGCLDRLRGSTDYSVWPRIALSAVDASADVSARRVPG